MTGWTLQPGIGNLVTPRRKLPSRPDRIAIAFAEEIDMGDDLGLGIGAHRAHVGDQPARADDHLDLAADLSGHGDRRVFVGGQRAQCRGVEADLRARAGDFEDVPDRRQRILGRSRFAVRAGIVGEGAHLVEELLEIWLVGHSYAAPRFKIMRRE